MWQWENTTKKSLVGISSLGTCVLVWEKGVWFLYIFSLTGESRGTFRIPPYDDFNLVKNNAEVLSEEKLKGLLPPKYSPPPKSKTSSKKGKAPSKNLGWKERVLETLKLLGL